MLNEEFVMYRVDPIYDFKATNLNEQEGHKEILTGSFDPEQGLIKVKSRGGNEECFETKV